MKKSLPRFLHFCMIMTSIVLINTSSKSLAFDSIIGSQIHQEITRTALGFLKDDILQAPIGGCDLILASGCRAGIIDGNDFEFDAQESNDSRIHFDSCNFSGASSYIRYQYNIVIGNILEGDGRAPELFGNLLHTVQDFYAHSNWIELGKKDTLFAPGIDEWPTLEPFSLYNGVIIVQNTTNAIMENHTLSRDGKVVWVDEVNPGLITGETDRFDGGCPVSIRIGHWDASPDNPDAAFSLFADSPEIGEPGYGSGLNKDNDTRPGFSEAKMLAIQQTTHEWCRLVNLVRQRGGETAVTSLFDAWVNPDKKQDAMTSCEITPNPTPDEATCPTGYAIDTDAIDYNQIRITAPGWHKDSPKPDFSSFQYRDSSYSNYLSFGANENFDPNDLVPSLNGEPKYELHENPQLSDLPPEFGRAGTGSPTTPDAPPPCQYLSIPGYSDTWNYEGLGWRIFYGIRCHGIGSLRMSIGCPTTDVAVALTQAGDVTFSVIMVTQHEKTEELRNAVFSQAVEEFSGLIVGLPSVDPNLEVEAEQNTTPTIDDSEPVVTNLGFSSSGSTIQLELSYIDGGGNAQMVEMTVIEHEGAVFSDSAEVIFDDAEIQKNGTATYRVNFTCQSNLSNTFQVKITDASGNESEPSYFRLDCFVDGTGQSQGVVLENLDLNSTVFELGAPQITEVEFVTSIENNTHFITVTFGYGDGDGDVSRADFEILESEGGEYRLRNFGLLESEEAQRRGTANYSFILDCPNDGNLLNVIQLSVVDRDGNFSEPAIFQIDCRPVGTGSGTPIGTVLQLGSSVVDETNAENTNTDTETSLIESCEIQISSVVNQRSGPGTNFDRLGQLSDNQTVVANGQADGADGFVWWRLDSGAWIRSDVVEAASNCSQLPKIDT